MTTVQLYALLLLAGLLLIGAEIYLPGGVIGFIGGVMLAAAVVIGFVSFPFPWSLISAVGIVILSGLCLLVWILYFPRTPVGRRLSLSNSKRDMEPGTMDLHNLLNREGIAASELRPGGIVELEGQRIDAVAEGTWIDRGSRIRVIHVEGNRVVVRKLDATGASG